MHFYEKPVKLVKAHHHAVFFRLLSYHLPIAEKIFRATGEGQRIKSLWTHITKIRYCTIETNILIPRRVVLY